MLLTLPSQQLEEPGREQLQAIATGCGPEGESALLMDLLTASPGLARSLADPLEAHTACNPLALVNSYKHRLHSLRCEYAQAQLRLLEAEEQLAEARLQILDLKAQVKHMDRRLQKIYASLLFRVLRRCVRRWRMLFPAKPSGQRGQ